jgi:hypothetical protein
MRLWLSGLCALVVAALSGEAMADDATVWSALQQGGKVIIMRHADAPGPEQGREGDPSGFRLDDCATQRNLSNNGRRQAAILGDRIREHNVRIARVMSSPWCRAKETAELMRLGPVEVDDHLANREREGGGGAATREMPPFHESMQHTYGMIRNWAGPGNLFLVSHGHFVSHLLWGPNRHSPEQAEMIVLQPEPNTPMGQHPFREVGSLSPP